MDSHYKRLRDLREDNDITQTEIAEYLGMKQAQYWRYECGYRDVPTDILIKLAVKYKTSIDYLLGITDVSKPYPRNNKITFCSSEDGV